MRLIDSAKILIVSDVRGDDDEGMKKIARRLCDELQHRGLETSVTSTLGVLSRTEGGEIVHFIGGPTLRTLLLVLIDRLINSNRSYILTFTNPIWAGFADIAARFIKPDLAIVSTSRWERKLKELGWRTCRLNVSGVDQLKFFPLAIEFVSNLKAKLELSPEKLVVLHVGHIKADRNLDLLLGCAREPNMQVVIIGSTTTAQSHEIKERLTNAGCIIIDRYLNNIEEFYQAADCYVFPTVDPRGAIQVPLSVMESLACGVPVVASDFGGLRDLFAEDQRVTFLEEEDESIIANIVRHHAGKFRDTVRVGLDDRFSWSMIAQDIARIYGSLSR